MFNYSDSSNKGKLYIISNAIIFINVIIYICLALSSEWYIEFDIFHKVSVPFNDIRLLFLAVSNCIMFFFILVSYIIINSDNEPRVNIFKKVGKVDFYFRIFVVIMTFDLLENRINISSKKYLFLFLIFSFIFNLYLENKIKICVNKTDELEIEHIINDSKIILEYRDAEKYKKVLKKAKKGFYVMVTTVLFKSVLYNTLYLSVYFIIYFVVLIYLLKDMYFLLYEKKQAIKKIVRYSVTMIIGFILVLLLNKKIIVFKLYNFSQTELIFLIAIFTFPFYQPIKKIYLALKRSNNIA